jgi:ribosomal protein L34E
VICAYCGRELNGMADTRKVDLARHQRTLPGVKQQALVCSDIAGCNARILEQERKRNGGEAR